MGTIAETIMVFVLFGESWSRWELSFKIVTPILHVVFTAAQLHGSRILLSMWRKEKRKLAEEYAELNDIEGVRVMNKKKDSQDAEEVREATVIVAGSSIDIASEDCSSPDSTEKPGDTQQQQSRTRKFIRAFKFLQPVGHYITGN